MDKNKFLEETKYVQNIINKYLPSEDGLQKVIFEAMNYSILAGGKRLRPMLILETYRLFNGKNEKEVYPFMAAIEMIHTYSLVHDDLPAMDNDEFRRGKKTTHAKYGEAIGILAGDALLNYAFETVCLGFDLTDNYKKVANAIKVLANKSGVYGMVGGQVVDVISSNQKIDEDKLNFIYKLKTSALIEASMMIGAIMAGTSETNIEKIQKIAFNVGLAFQIQDDILDVTSSLEKLGKSVDSDKKNNKTTYVTIKGIENAKRDVKEISENAINILNELEYQNEFLKELIEMLITRER